MTASGVRYAPDASVLALGPYHLGMVRDWYTCPTAGAGGPGRWWREGGDLDYRSRGGCYPVLVSWSEARWWGCLARLCSNDHCEVVRVVDTGRAALEADLPDETWARFGYPVERGVFTATLEVLTWRE